MAIILNDNLKINVGKPVDSKYLNGLITYADKTEVLSTIGVAERYIGLTVNIDNEEYWFKDDILVAADLVKKFQSFTGGTVVIGADNIGSGTSIFNGEITSISGDTLQFRSIVGSGSTIVSTNGTEVIIYSTGNTDGVVSGMTYIGSTLTLERTQGLPDLTVSIVSSGASDGVVSGGTLIGTDLYLERTQGLPDVIIDLSALSGGTGNNKQVFVTTASDISVSGSVLNGVYVASGTTGYTLTAAPTTGAEITFVDELGTAGTTNIRIEGNGKIIYDDTYALINTDNGSITLTYNGYKWNVNSFVI